MALLFAFPIVKNEMSAAYVHVQYRYSTVLQSSSVAGGIPGIPAGISGTLLYDVYTPAAARRRASYVVRTTYAACIVTLLLFYAIIKASTFSSRANKRMHR